MSARRAPASIAFRFGVDALLHGGRPFDTKSLRPFKNPKRRAEERR